MRKYILPGEVPEEKLGDLVERTHSVAAAKLLYNRGFRSYEEFETFCKGSDAINHEDLYDLPSALKLLSTFVKSSEKICVYGDYDVDGMVAGSILWRFLAKHLSLDATVYIPNRHEEGYGLNNDALQDIYDKGSRLVITVDCGIRDFELIKEWQQKGLQFIVTDHHQPGESIPECPIVHPLYPDHEAVNKYTSGSVVAWKLIRYLESEMGKVHSFSDSVIDLVGLSLITDMMPLRGENRRILQQALLKAKTGASLPVKLILQANNVKIEDISAYHFGFVVGPRLNASGRVGDAYQSLRLLSTDKYEFAQDLIKTIEETNIRRQEIMKHTMYAADDNKKIVNNGIIIAYHEEWDDGVIGLVAGRLMNKYDMPTIVMTKERSTGLMKGSARSINNLNITEVLEGFKEKLAKYGGHHAAAGFTTSVEAFEDFYSAFENYFIENYSSYVPENSRPVDLFITPAEATHELLDVLKKLEPFGQENPAPIIIVHGFIEQVNLMGANANHARITLETEGIRLNCVYFNCESVIQKIKQGEEIAFIGKLKEDNYNGRNSLQFIVDDIFEPQA